MDHVGSVDGQPDGTCRRSPHMQLFAAFFPVLVAFYCVSFLVLFPWGSSDLVPGVNADGEHVEVWAFGGLRQRDLSDPKLRYEVPFIVLYLPFVGMARLFGYHHVLLGGRELAVGG